MADTLDGMTLEQQIGQLFMVGFHGTTASGEIIEMIERYQVGGVILFTRNVRDSQQVQALTNSLQAAAQAAGHRFPLLIATDQENGVVRRLGEDIAQFPGNMALGAVGSEQLVQEVAEATGDELRALGINMNLAPVADVNNNPANPVIGVRSFGEDPEAVARLVAASVRGHRAAGVIATLKHFPGHGDTNADSHRSLPVVLHTLDRLSDLELVPFQSGIAAGADAILTAHLALPRLTSDESLPATLSSAILRGLLRERLGFAGVIVSDCLEMNAIAEGVGVEQGAVLAIGASVDLVLISHRADRQRGGIEAAHAAVAAGTLSPDLIREAAERVVRLKNRYLAWDALPAPAALDAIGSAAHRRLRDDAYLRSTTLVCDDAGLIPARMQPSQRILVVALHGGETSQAVDLVFSNDALVERIRRYHANVGSLTITPTATEAERQRLPGEVEAADLVILATLNAYRDERQVALAQSLIQAGRPIIGIATCDPYDIAALPTLRTYLATYEYTSAALAAAVDVIFGATQPHGRLPVTLPQVT